MTEDPTSQPKASKQTPTQAKVDKAPLEGAASDRAFEALDESKQLSEGAQLLLATALVDAVQGRNVAYRNARLRNHPDAMKLAFIEATAPPMIAKMATMKLQMMSDQPDAVEVLSDALRGMRTESGAKNIFKKIFGR